MLGIELVLMHASQMPYPLYYCSGPLSALHNEKIQIHIVAQTLAMQRNMLSTLLVLRASNATLSDTAKNMC